MISRIIVFQNSKDLTHFPEKLRTDPGGHLFGDKAPVLFRAT